MSSIFGGNNFNAVTLDTDQSISGKKRFLNDTNEFEGIMVQPIIEALGQTIDPTELSFLAGASSNIQNQFAGINVVLTGLTALEQALQAIEPAPNATTVQFNTTLLLDDGVGNTITAGVNQINFTTASYYPSVISNSSGQDMNIASQSNLNLYSGAGLVAISDGGIISLTANYDPINISAGGGDITLSSPNMYNINLDTENLNAYGYALPICFTRERHDNFSYNVGGQQMEQVYNMPMNVPYQFFADSPQANYTSSIWKIDFALNCYDCSVTGDKGRALYIEFTDQNGTVYTPNTYNLEFPYAVWDMPSQYNGVSHSNFQNFNWSDYVDFHGLFQTGSGNLPLNCYLYFAGDQPLNSKIIMTVTLTRTNQI